MCDQLHFERRLMELGCERELSGRSQTRLARLDWLCLVRSQPQQRRSDSN